MLADITRVRWPHMKKRRDLMRELRYCICGPMAPPGTPSKHNIVHGEVVKAGKCARCVGVHDGKEKR